MQNFREIAIRAGSARTCAQAGCLLLRVGSVILLARLLDPTEFGLVGMATAVIGVLNPFRDLGLKIASIQQATITEEQSSTLFWLNVLIGGALTVVVAALSGAVSAFYQEPQLVWITSALALGFLFSGASVQHTARLQREMRFQILAFIDVLAMVTTILIAIGLAATGYGYWALVAMSVCVPLITTIGVWLAAAWVPKRPRYAPGIQAMVLMGGAVTLSSAVGYFATNIDKILLGRFWGAEVLGLYGRAAQLIGSPTENINFAVGDVAFAALSRLQNDPIRFKRYFLKCYSLVVALTLPATIACAVFADDLVYVLLGPKWAGAADFFRLLAPTIVVFCLAGPMSWLLNSLGLVRRGLKITLAFAPLKVIGIVLGLPYGAEGVAFGYSIAMILGALPVIAWSVHGTVVRAQDIGLALIRPLTSIFVAACVALAVGYFFGSLLSPVTRLSLEGALFGLTYLAGLLLPADRTSLYLDLLREIPLFGRLGIRKRLSGATAPWSQQRKVMP